MKTLLKTLSILTLSILSFSCGNDDEPKRNSTAKYFFKAKIDGTQYQTEGNAFQVAASNLSDKIKISTITSDNKSFELEIVRPTGVGTYTYPNETADYLLRMQYSDGTSATSIWSTGTCAGTTSGTLVITTLSATEISGTFSFTGKRTSFCSDAAKVITEGSFKAGFIREE